MGGPAGQAPRYELSERPRLVNFLIRDRGTKFTAAFDEIFRTEGTRIIRTPVRAPRANAFAERFVGTVRRTCFDRMLVVNRHHLDTVLREYVEHYNCHRPHRSLGQVPPPSRLRRADRLGGLIHEYCLVA